MILLFIGFVLMACTRRAVPPPRPRGVPEAAVWAGGVDGGSFIKCTFEPADSLNKCSVYNDYTGRLEVDGLFRISGPSKADDVGNFTYSAFDGRRIYLKDGSVLTLLSDGEAGPQR